MLKTITVCLMLICCSVHLFAQTDSTNISTPVPTKDTIAAPPIDPAHAVATVMQATLKIWIKGFRSLKGSVFVGLYNKPQGFATENAYRNFSYEITGTEMWVAFDSLVKGSYAIAIIHDENNNHKLDQGEMGIPVEGYGFSNDARGLFGPPDFRLAMFYFAGTATKTVVINLLYPKKIK
jgi:uncharacterized protein (DUF2141 family)